METVRSKIIRCLLEKQTSLNPSQIVEITGEKPNSVRGSLVSLLKKGVIDKAKLGNESTEIVHSQFVSMKEITNVDFKKFYDIHNEVDIENVKVKLHNKWEIIKYAPTDFLPETTTVWSFPNRGDWATHSGNYRGNWSPFIPRNLILKYT